MWTDPIYPCLVLSRDKDNYQVVTACLTPPHSDLSLVSLGDLHIHVVSHPVNHLLNLAGTSPASPNEY